jgi:hypothetical protein
VFRHFPWLLLSPDTGEGNGSAGDSSLPKNEDSEGDDKSLATKKFDEGYGRGIRKGKKEGGSEGAQWALSELGLPDNLEDAKAKLKGIKSTKKAESKTVDTNVTETDEYKALAKEYRVLGEQNSTLLKNVERLQVLESQALESSIKDVLIKNGIAADTRLDALAKLHRNKFKIGDDGKLIVLHKTPDGHLVDAGQSPDKFVKELIKTENLQWALAADNVGGAGSGKDQSESKKATSQDPLGPRPYDINRAIAAFSGVKVQGPEDAD